jgi:hypothetical protein
MQIPCTMSGFPPTRPTAGTMDAPIAKVMWAAATVGVSPTVATVGSRPLIEVCWRMAMAAAALSQHGHHWKRSVSYNRLDASEKGAMSFFLGMTMAQLACADVLGIPSLVHLDRVLALLGRSTRRSRPDFLGIDPQSNTLSVAVEAKGRTNAYDGQVLAKAKKQALSLPAVTGTTSTLALASLAYFERDLFDPTPLWRCHLLIALHYQPIAAAMRSAQSTPVGTYLRAPLLEMDAWLWAPTSVVSLAAEPRQERGPREMASLGADIEGAVLDASVDESETALTLQIRSQEDPTLYLGANLVALELGSSWM